ncbi:MAG: MMPL family transporter [Polyangiales bacterium]
MPLCRRYLARCETAPVVVLLCLAVVSALAVWGASTVAFDTRLLALLPPDSEAMRDLSALEQRGTTGTPLQLLVTSPDPAANRRVAGWLADELVRWPDVRWAEVRRGAERLRAKQLLIVPASELEGWADQLEGIVAWEQCERMPGCVQLDDRPPDLDLDDVRARLAAQPDLANLGRLLREPVTTLGTSTGTADDVDVGALCNDDGDVCAVEASLRGEARDVTVAEDVLRRAEALGAEAVARVGAPDMRVVVSGPVRNAAMNKRVAEADLQRISLLSGALVALVLLVQFRSPRWALVILAPVLAAGAITLALVAAVGQPLNLIASFSFAILMGVGVDFGIHLAAHYRAARAEGLPAAHAVAHTLDALGNSLGVAALSTAVAFFALTFAAFPGFAQMGWVAGAGVVAAWVANLLWFPPLVSALERLRPERAPSPRADGPRPLDVPPRPGRRLPLVVAGVGLLGACVLGALATRVTVQEDFRRLQPEGIAHGLDARGALHGTQGVEVQLYGEDPAQVRAAALAIAQRVGVLADADDARVGEALVLTAAALASDEQPRRLSAIARVHEQLLDLPEALDPELRAQVDQLRPLFAVHEPIGPADLPPFVRDALVDAQGRLGHIALVIVRASGSDARAMMQLSQVLAEVRGEHPSVALASPPALLGEVLPALYHDAPWVVLLALLGLSASTFALSRSLGRLALVLLAVAVTSAVTGGVLALCGLSLNLYNMVILPAAFGIAVDGAVYVVWARAGEGSGPEQERALRVSRGAILGSTVTTLSAFGSLATSTHPGVASLGLVGALAVGLASVVNLVWLPAVLNTRWVGRRFT